MLQRNGKDNVLYAQQAALYCQLVLHQESGLGLVDFCFAIDDGSRKQFLQLDQLWDGYYAPRFPGYEHSSALVKCLASYKHDKVQFIHRTARDYVLQTAEGQELLAACPISEDQQAQICFECRLISEGVLPAILGVPINTFSFARTLFGCTICQANAQWPLWTDVIQSLCDMLLRKELIQTLDPWIPLIRGGDY
ncbi:hypothetical protein LTR70_010347 [Exophiala xenobiotica]|uniref:Uncharacterized protein n=1 Tax=Lithohypha guttulata TaxID=1690604 RepID=A0ABR0JVD7_9EURO|nr:hypothetical protein LTR24_009978 [Lithohypha guttulata]KAK5309369.1 hypothetical protein LTR70_010347 [Exophiala xenobiotica]